MKIRNIKIRNFRGIKELDWVLPDRSLFCLIGKGDSTKSTILEAIRYAFYPQWNLISSDSDFYLSQTHESIIIEITIGDIPSEFCSLDRYGQFLFGWDREASTCIGEPDDGCEEVLIIRFDVGEDLEPHWNVIGHSMEAGTAFKQNDRIKANISLIGSYTDHHLTWGKGSVLTQVTESANVNLLLANVARSAKKTLDESRTDNLNNFDAAAQKAESIAKILGVPVSHHYKVQLDSDDIQFNQGGLSLHDGNIPLRQLGLGSRRMLICGLQKESLAQTHITLFDEVEIGLEPHRIARLLKHILADKSGQYFLTTHSPTVLRELTINELYIVHNHNGEIQIQSASDKNLGDINVQGNMRSHAEAFLGKKIIVCEGATEAGFARGLDNYWIACQSNSFSFQGVTIIDSGGAKKIKDLASGLKSLHYDIAVIVDGDSPENFSSQDTEDLKKQGIEVIMWANEISLEQQVMLDLPWEYVCKCVKLAQIEFNKPVYDNIHSHLSGMQSMNINEWQDSIECRKAIGYAAKKSSWFKDISRGELWVAEISPAFAMQDIQKTDLNLGIVRLRKWVDND